MQERQRVGKQRGPLLLSPVTICTLIRHISIQRTNEQLLQAWEGIGRFLEVCFEGFSRECKTELQSRQSSR